MLISYMNHLLPHHPYMKQNQTSEEGYVKLTMNTEGWGAGIYEIYIYSNSDNVPASANITPDSVSYDKNPVMETGNTTYFIRKRKFS